MKQRTYVHPYYGTFTLTLWPHGDLQVTNGDETLYGGNHYWEMVCHGCGYGNTYDAAKVWDSFEELPLLFNFFE